uniref:MADS-box domain-containing protein n=1 Tax=Kalanchoe fedtschenkoi TaxID=63787 RepID=A0A7N0UFP1_KALFE
MATGESSNNQQGKKRTRGRQKTQMRLVQREEDRLITFSKRKAGINKKATELCVMCDAQVAFILFSPKGNAFSYGHPDVKSVVNKFLGREEYPINGDPRVIELIDEHRRERNEELVEFYNVLQHHVTEYAKHKELVKQMAESRGDDDHMGWWDSKVEDMKTADEVKGLCRNIVGFQEALCHHMEMLQLIHQAAPPPPANPTFRTTAFFQEPPFLPPPQAAATGAPMALGGAGGEPSMLGAFYDGGVGPSKLGNYGASSDGGGY